MIIYYSEDLELSFSHFIAFVQENHSSRVGFVQYKLTSVLRGFDDLIIQLYHKLTLTMTCIIGTKETCLIWFGMFSLNFNKARYLTFNIVEQKLFFFFENRFST